MARLTEEQLINEVMHLHSLHRQGPPTPNPNPYSISNPNPPISNPTFIPNFNPIPNPITHPIHSIPNPNHIPHPSIFNPSPSSIYPIPNPNRSSVFNPSPNCIYPNNDPVIPILRPDHNSSTRIFNHDHGFVVPAIARYDSHCYARMCLSNEPVSSVCSYVPRNVEGVNHGNLNKKLSRLSLAVPLTKPKKKKNKKKRGKKGVGSNDEAKKWPPISENEWPCNPMPEPTVGWPELKLKPVVERVLTEEENARLVASKSQQRAMDAAKEMFRESMNSDGEVDDCVSSDDDDDDEVDDEDECEEYKFFSKVFTEDSELRSYYEKNCESGEFSCLVCVGIGQKVGKKFKDCVALVQHSITIAKTKKRQAHRALGKVICKVLGWEIQKLPSINLPKISDSEGNGPHDPNEVVQDKNDSVGEVLPDTSVSLTTDVGSELMVCEDSLMASDDNKSVDTFLNDIPSTPKK